MITVTKPSEKKMTTQFPWMGRRCRNTNQSTCKLALLIWVKTKAVWSLNSDDLFSLFDTNCFHFVHSPSARTPTPPSAKTPASQTLQHPIHALKTCRKQSCQVLRHAPGWGCCQTCPHPLLFGLAPPLVFMLQPNSSFSTNEAPSLLFLFRMSSPYSHCVKQIYAHSALT